MKKLRFYSQYLYLFLIGSFVGYLWEGIYRVFVLFFSGNVIEWRHYKGLLYGPFSPVYGIAAVVLVFLLANRGYSKKRMFFIATIASGVIEFSLGFLQEFFFNVISWDYSGRLLNIGGRTTLIYMIVWGLLATLFIAYVYPHIKKVVDKINDKLNLYLTIFLTIFLVFNIIISSLAMYRYEKRYQGLEPANKTEIFLDKHYHDKYMKKKFRNVIWLK